MWCPSFLMVLPFSSVTVCYYGAAVGIILSLPLHYLPQYGRSVGLGRLFPGPAVSKFSFLAFHGLFPPHDVSFLFVSSLPSLSLPCRRVDLHTDIYGVYIYVYMLRVCVCVCVKLECKY